MKVRKPIYLQYGFIVRTKIDNQRLLLNSKQKHCTTCKVHLSPTPTPLFSFKNHFQDKEWYFDNEFEYSYSQILDIYNFRYMIKSNLFCNNVTSTRRSSLNYLKKLLVLKPFEFKKFSRKACAWCIMKTWICTSHTRILQNNVKMVLV